MRDCCEQRVPSPRRREVGNQVIAFIHGITADESPCGGYQGAVGKHGPFGQAGRAGSVVDKGGVVTFTGVNILLKEVGVRFFIFFALFQNLIKTHEEGVVIVSQTLGVPVNDLLYERQVFLDFQELIGLLLVVNDGKFSVGMLGDIF